jgi:hypothetical protein
MRLQDNFKSLIHKKKNPKNITKYLPQVHITAHIVNYFIQICNFIWIILASYMIFFFAMEEI